ncbi:MAG: cysteine desulfurase [Actinobacteria bacterium]|nr:cysteine desulfurase [Actinomycetota bacterium]MCL5445231.1 cysteine desulfurase [Actinomycetota bacterium]
MTRHYLDHASTSTLRPDAARAIQRWLETLPGDPARIHEDGHRTRVLIEEARENVAELAGVSPRQVVFTSGGTEAANTATWAAARSRPGASILCSNVEHSAVRDASKRLAPVEEIPVERSGRIDPASVADMLSTRRSEPPALLHCQWANHEVGTVQPVAEIVELCHEHGVRVHVDAAAAFGHIAKALGELGADMYSLSAHKLGGPPGIGALILKKGTRIEPMLVGGQQERSRRAGMENVPGIAGFGAVAALLADDDRSLVRTEISTARRHIDELIKTALNVDGVTFVGEKDPLGRLPHLACLGVEGIEAEPILLGLDRAGIGVHSGSACSSEYLSPSPVLEAMGVDSNRSLRISVGWSTTRDDIDAFNDAFPTVVEGLAALRVNTASASASKPRSD